MDASQRTNMDKYVQQAKQEGAKVFQECASIPKSGKGLFYPSTLSSLRSSLCLHVCKKRLVFCEDIVNWCGSFD